MPIIISWKPAAGIVGSNSGIATWSSPFPLVKVTSPQSSGTQSLPGAGWIPVTLPIPLTNDIVYSFKFVGVVAGREVSPAFINVPVYRQPLVIASWTPATSYDPRFGLRNYLGFLSYYTVGAVSLTADGKPLTVSNNRITRIEWSLISKMRDKSPIVIKATSSVNFTRIFNVNWNIG
jgi:hypothetical protein